MAEPTADQAFCMLAESVNEKSRTKTAFVQQKNISQHIALQALPKSLQTETFEAWKAMELKRSKNRLVDVEIIHHITESDYVAQLRGQSIWLRAGERNLYDGQIISVVLKEVPGVYEEKSVYASKRLQRFEAFELPPLDLSHKAFIGYLKACHPVTITRTVQIKCFACESITDPGHICPLSGTSPFYSCFVSLSVTYND